MTIDVESIICRTRDLLDLITKLTAERNEAVAEAAYFKELAEERNDRICELLEDSIARRAALDGPATEGEGK